jgi:Uma2 family endonuclease
MTAEEFFAWASLPENRDARAELERGQITETPPVGKFHGFVCGNVCGILGNYATARGYGHVCADNAGLIVERDPDTVRGPDETFYEEFAVPGQKPG